MIPNNDMKHKLFTLSNGLRCLHLSVPRAVAGYAGVAVNAGARNELTPERFGLAHFVEHTIFKGTQRRSSWHIINRMETVGGELNAFTTKENTVIYTTFPRPYLDRALELIADLVINSRFPVAEVEREREVIIDEIASYLDSPAEAVYDDFEDLLYHGTPLGHNILGTPESVRGISPADCRDWLDRYYRPDNMVVFYAGAVGPDTFVRTVERHLGSLQPAIAESVSPIGSGTAPTFNVTTRTGSHQAHTVAGTRLPALDLRDTLTLALLTNIIGGPGMNSRLNIALRERRGLVYNVESTMTSWSDTTMFTTYFGCDPEDTDRCLSLVRDTIERLACEPLTDRAMAAARKQYLGQMMLALENTENRIQGMARNILTGRPLLSMADVTALLSDISASDLCRMARRTADMSVLTLAP